MAALYLLDGQPDFAASYARQGFDLHPGNLDLEVALATAQAASELEFGGDLGEAAERLEELHRLRPNDPVLAFNAAQALTLAGLVERAEPVWRAFLELEPTGEWAEIARWKVGDDAEAAEADQPAR
jgi:Flp pilus assembly protein TadD